jgi:hypothetical protein
MSAGACIAWCVAMTSGCSQPVIEPEIAPSTPHATYAETYPARVNTEVSGYGDAQIKLKELDGGFKSYPDALDDEADYGLVADMVEEADTVGRSGSYVDSVRELEAVQTFYDEERVEIRKKVAGTVAYQAKQKNCDTDLGGAAAGALDKSMKERIEERMRDANAAQRMLDRHRDKLGKKNVEALEKQLGEVSLASYLAHIQLVEHKLRLRRMAEEAEEVKKTAESQIETEKAFQKEKDVSDKDKEASQKRISAMNDAKSGADTAANKAKKALEDIEPRIEKAQKAHQDALTALVEALRKRAKK